MRKDHVRTEDVAMFHSFFKGGRQDLKLRDLLIRSNMALAVEVLSLFIGRGEDYEDLFQVAVRGLITAIDRYDPNMGKFSSYAVPVIKGTIKNHLRDNCWHVHVPAGQKDFHEMICKVQVNLTAELGRLPSVREIALAIVRKKMEKIGHSPSDHEIAPVAKKLEQEILEVLEIDNARNVLSLEYPLVPEEGDDPLEAMIGRIDPTMERVVLHSDLYQAIDLLTDRLRLVVQCLFFLGMTQEETAKVMNCTRQNIGFCRISALKFLREILQQGA